ncbi:3187_t:CDS:2 [Ambispora leptoticha]|uniref:3187_t:CDS:1 n=1 Tax=Ambispora leptoticha TaxID=144679 RepID=A0A9N9E8N5_9GLOM|nr:3187_t:CDS:2 [Ambispora leptoticha]
MPEVGVYPSQEINAFATGPAGNTLIAFSTNLVNTMNLQEVRGVVGHELSHLIHHDIARILLVQGAFDRELAADKRVDGVDLTEDDNTKATGEPNSISLLKFNPEKKKKGLLDLFRTHPTLEERIERLEKLKKRRALPAGGGFLIIKNNSKTKNVANNQPTRKEKEPILPKDNPPPKPNIPPTPNLPQPNPIPEPNNPPQPNNNEYPAIAATGREPEYKINPSLPISSVGTGNDRPDLVPNLNGTPGHLTAGSALLTDTLDGSGNGSSILNDKGITHLIHAVNQPFSSFANNEQWFINYVVRSVQNSIILADRYKFEKLAIPLVGGGIFLGSCDPQKLAEGIVKGAINQLAECKTYNKLFCLTDIIAKPPEKIANGGLELAKNPTKIIFDEWGDIRDKRIHEASVIVNVANTQVKFGGGISGAIAKQVGDKTKIEAKAQELIEVDYNSLVKARNTLCRILQTSRNEAEKMGAVGAARDVFREAARLKLLGDAEKKRHRNMLQIETRHLEIIRSILSKYPYQFYAYGSRVKNRAKKYSDLDICFYGEIPWNVLSHLQEDLEESDLPFKVEVMAWE